jgi:asparagine synthase (glutamine-hydrolysing)
LIAGVLALGAARPERKVLPEIAAAVKAEPDGLRSLGATTVAAWSALAPPGRLDPQRGVASVGVVRGEVPGAPGTDAGPYRLEGDFALIAGEGESLRLACGLFGGRPLYYTWLDEDCLVACSRLAPLVRLLGPAPALCEEALAAAIAAVPCPDAAATLYSRIRRVTSGEVLHIGRSVRRGRLVEPFAGPPVNAARLPEDGGTEVIAALREEFLRSVDRAVDGARRIAVFAGGGLDSSAVLAAAVARSRGPARTGSEVCAVALDFSGPCDDRPHLRALAARLGITPIRVTPAECGAKVREALVIDAAPQPWPTAGSELTLASAARAWGADLILTGAGGDELLGGPFSVFADEMAAGHAFGAIRGALTAQLAWNPSRWRRAIDLLARPLIMPRLPRPNRVVRAALHAHRLRRSFPWARSRMLKALDAEDTSARGHESWVADLACSTRTLDLAVTRAQLEVASGCTFRAPIFDVPLGRTIASIPTISLWQGNMHRGLFRRAMAGLLPDSVRFRPDKAYLDPALRDMVASAGGFAALDDLADVPALADLGLVEPAVFRCEFQRVVGGDERAWLSVWAVLATEACVRQALGYAHERR